MAEKLRLVFDLLAIDFVRLPRRAVRRRRMAAGVSCFKTAQSPGEKEAGSGRVGSGRVGSPGGSVCLLPVAWQLCPWLLELAPKRADPESEVGPRRGGAGHRDGLR